MTNPSAKDVAKELDRRHRRRKLIILGGWLVLVVLAALYLRCGRGWGIGGGAGTGGGVGSGSSSPAPQRCRVRVTSKGLELEGKPATRGQIIAGCKQGVDVVVTGDARQGDWDDLRTALGSANIESYSR